MARSPKDIRIAVVDDETMILDVFSELLKKAQFQPTCFQDPLDALESIHRHPDKYHLLITDIFMPGGDGIEFAERVRGIVPGIPILFMTGNASAETRERASRLGKVEFLEKPFPLIDKLTEIINRSII